jgi:hypothetical protein
MPFMLAMSSAPQGRVAVKLLLRMIFMVKGQLRKTDAAECFPRAHTAAAQAGATGFRLAPL